MSCEFEPIKISDYVSSGIALFAFGAACWQAKIARDHNKVSVMPMIVQQKEWELTPTMIVMNYQIKNVGAGVAIVSNRYFNFNSERFEPINPNNLIEELCELIFEKFIEYHIKSTGMFGVTAKIPPGATITIAKIHFPNPHTELKNVIEELSNKFSFVIEYESLYKEKFRFASDD